MYGYANGAVLMRFVSLGFSSLLLWGILILPHLYYVNGLCQKKNCTHTYTHTHTHTHSYTNKKGARQGRGNKATVEGGAENGGYAPSATPKCKKLHRNLKGSFSSMHHVPRRRTNALNFQKKKILSCRYFCCSNPAME